MWGFPEQSLFIAVITCLFASSLSVYQIKNHLLYNSNPKLRKYTVRILAMVPVYSIESVCGMWFRSEAMGFTVVRECYESLALYSFLQYLVVCLGGKAVLADTLRSKKPVYHLWPLCYMNAWHMGPPFLRNTSVGILQYVPIRLLAALVAFITESLGCYGDGQFKVNQAYLWLTLVVNFSQMWAIYCLVLFYLGTREELKPIGGFGKFCLIKFIIFFTWWQSVMIALAVQFKYISADRFNFICGHQGSGDMADTIDCWTTNEVAESLQDVVICMEMLVCAVAHHYVFPIPSALEYDQTRLDERYRPGYQNNEPLLDKVFDAVNLKEIAMDVKNVDKPILTRKQELVVSWEQHNDGSDLDRI